MLQADDEDDMLEMQMKSPFGSSFRTFNATDYKPIGKICCFSFSPTNSRSNISHLNNLNTEFIKCCCITMVYFSISVIRLIPYKK